MLAENRQKWIADRLSAHDSVTTAELVRELSVSAETIRRDLLEMEELNLLRRVHGGAVRASAMKPFDHLEHRSHQNVDKKQALSRAAAALVRDDDFIGIDMGSTAIYFARALKETCSRLTVITHALDVFDILRGYKNFNVILCGGHYMPRENSFYGPLTLDMLDRMHLGKAFIFPSAVSMEAGITDHQQDFYLIQKKMTEISDSIYILADSSKFGKKALLKLCDMRQDYTYVTDSAIDDTEFRLLSENNFVVHKGTL